MLVLSSCLYISSLFLRLFFTSSAVSGSNIVFVRLFNSPCHLHQPASRSQIYISCLILPSPFDSPPHSFPPQNGPSILTGAQEHFKQHAIFKPYHLCLEQSFHLGLAFSRTCLIIHHGGPQEHNALQPSDGGYAARHIHPHHPPH